MIYVFDTSAFIVLKHFYPSTFPSLWTGLDQLISKGQVVSVREVFNELADYNDPDFIQNWAKRNKQIFGTPSGNEQSFVQKILAVRHFQALIGSKAILKGTPVADPFVVAAAWARKGTVVTQEQLKPNAAKIPNVCQHFKIPWMNLETFMANQGWSF